MEINKKAFTVLELLIVIAIMAILAAMAQPHTHRSRPSARQKACFSNIRVIQGAVEMYNMDSSTMMKELDLNLLINGNGSSDIKYLKYHPTKPEVSCSYISIGDLSDDGVIACEYHGDIEQKYIKSKIDN